MPDDKRGLDHAWQYFSLHANQRITVFNYFIVFAGLLSAGIAAAIQSTREIAFIGVALGLLLTVLSFLFWKLDQRTSFLIKLAEEAIRELEPDDAPLLATERTKTASAKVDQGIWTYGRALRTIFAITAAIGFVGALLSGARAAGSTWLVPVAERVGPARDGIVSASPSNGVQQSNETCSAQAEPSPPPVEIDRL